MKKELLTCFLIILTYSLTLGQDIEGKWYSLVGANTYLTLSIEKENDGWKANCNMRSPMEHHVGIPVENIMYEGDSLKFTFFSNDNTHTFKGEYDETSQAFTGLLTVSKYGLSYYIDLEKELDEPPAPQFNYYEELRAEPIFTRQDTLRGSVTPERAWWDVTYYHLDVKINIEDSTIQGTNTIQYKVLHENNTMQIDLQPPLSISKVLQDNKALKFSRNKNVYYIELNKKQKPGKVNEIVIHYSGKPKVAQNPPWDGGFTWRRDHSGKPFIATACQGIGASVWWPNKDHMYDEVDSMLISVNVPENLVGVANGRLRNVDNLRDGTKTFHWFVSNPINNYGVNVNIADYAHFSATYQGAKGTLDCDYYVRKENIKDAKSQFKQVPMMLEAFEYWFGPYPFYEDRYKLVEVPYPGMEHQSSVTYGNAYENGYLGKDLSGTGWGLKFDFIIIHESGHEWFANNITYKDAADMWLHEGFTNYSESLYLEYHYGKEAGEEYIQGLRKNILNDIPLIGKYGVNHEGSKDMYYKGSNTLHTLRQVVNDDTLWRNVLRGLNAEFYHSTVTTKEIEDYISNKTGLNLDAFFDQYLRRTELPVLEYYYNEDKLVYRWINTVSDFEMPVKIYLDGSPKWIHPKTIWTHEYVNAKNKNLKIDPNFYVGSSDITVE